MGNHPSFSSPGPSAPYQPKTTDESDSTIGGTIVPHVNAQGPVIGALADAATPDLSASGASFSLVSLLKGSVSNLLAIKTALLAGIGVTPAATESHLGEIGGNVAKSTIAFGPSSSTTYAAGQVLLATTALAGMGRVANGTGVLFGANLALNVANVQQVDAVLFSAQPSGTYTAGAAFTIAAADLPKVSKLIHIDDWAALGAAVSQGQASDKGPRLYRCDDTSATQSLWVVLVARGSITLAAATDGILTVRASRN